MTNLMMMMTICFTEATRAVRKERLRGQTVARGGAATQCQTEVCIGKFEKIWKIWRAANEKFGINCASAKAQFGTGRGIIPQRYFEIGMLKSPLVYYYFDPKGFAMIWQRELLSNDFV